MNIFYSWPVQNTIVILLFAFFAFFAWRLSKRDYWRLAAKEIAHKKAAVISFVILAIYLAIAVLDSVGWSRPLINKESGKLMTHPQTGRIIYDTGATALDYILAPLTEKKEKTYSSPLAETQFNSTSEPDGKGGVIRVNKPLNHPGQHLLGTDMIGSDVLVLSLKSIRTGMIVGFLTTLLAIPFALFFGLCAGFYGGWVDDAVQYICTLLSSIPSVLLIAAMMVVFGRGLPQLCLAMGIASWTGLCRLLRGEAMRLREADFTQAAVAMGVPSWKIILRHLLPNVLHLVLINIVLRFSGEVLAEAALTYLGIGVDAETMSWGTMINDARSELTRDPIIWWKLSSAFVFMAGLLLPANIFGDALRDALDPRLRTQ